MNPLRRDPTRTTMLRNQAQAATRRRFGAVATAITGLVATTDAFGLKRAVPTVLVEPGEWRFVTDEEKVALFLAWLQGQIDQHLLEPTTDLQDLWLSGYVRSAYRRGAIRAYADTLPEVLAPNKPFYMGGRAVFLEQTFNAPVAVRRLRLLYTRSYEQLKGITADMAAKMSVVLADGLAHGKHPYDIAKQLVTVAGITSRRRAEVLARTEIIHAYAEAQLDAFEALGIDELKAVVEWSTAGDDRVCPQCAALGGRLFAIEEARGLIPLHPQCRCCWVPAAPQVWRNRSRQTLQALETAQ